MSKLILGAPSLTGKDANELVAEKFGGIGYPARIRFTSLVGMALSFPEVSGLFMKPIGHDGEESVVVEIKSHDAFQRLASSIEQIAELNGKAALLEVEAYVDDIIEQDDDLAAAEAAAKAAEEAAKLAEEERLAKEASDAEAAAKANAESEAAKSGKKRA